MVDLKDRAWFQETVVQQLQTECGVKWSADDFNRVLFADFLTRDEKIYKEVKNFESLGPLYREYLEDYNLGGKEMHLVFFRDAIEHVARINRIIRQPRGNALLVRVAFCVGAQLCGLACN